MSDRLLLLGTGTCQLQSERKASSALVERDDLRVVFDLGRGIADRLTELGLRQDDIGHLVLSHFHPDHLSDLVPYLHAACWSQIDPRSRDLHIWGPPGLEVQMMRLLSLFDAGTLRRDTFEVHLHERPAGALEIGGLRFETAELPPAGNQGLAFRHGGLRYVLTGDSSFHAEEVAFVRDSEVAVIDSGHLTDDEIVELAVAAGPRRMICSHLYRELDPGELTARAADRGFQGRIEVGSDGLEIPL